MIYHCKEWSVSQQSCFIQSLFTRNWTWLQYDRSLIKAVIFEYTSQVYLAFMYLIVQDYDLVAWEPLLWRRKILAKLPFKLGLQPHLTVSEVKHNHCTPSTLLPRQTIQIKENESSHQLRAHASLGTLGDLAFRSGWGRLVTSIA